MHLRVGDQSAPALLDVAPKATQQVGLARPGVAEQEQHPIRAYVLRGIDGALDQLFEGGPGVLMDLLDVERIGLEHRHGLLDRREDIGGREKRMEPKVSGRQRCLGGGLCERPTQRMELGDPAAPARISFGHAPDLAGGRDQPAHHPLVAFERLGLA